MAQPINLMVNLAQVSEVGRLQQIERDRLEGDKEYRSLVIKTTSHFAEERVEAMAQNPASRVEPRNEGGSGAGYFGGRQKNKKKGEEGEGKKEDILYLPRNFRLDMGQRIDVVR